MAAGCGRPLTIDEVQPFIQLADSCDRDIESRQSCDARMSPLKNGRMKSTSLSNNSHTFAGFCGLFDCGKSLVKSNRIIKTRRRDRAVGCSEYAARGLGYRHRPTCTCDVHSRRDHRSICKDVPRLGNRSRCRVSDVIAPKPRFRLLRRIRLWSHSDSGWMTTNQKLWESGNSIGGCSRRNANSRSPRAVSETPPGGILGFIGVCGRFRYSPRTPGKCGFGSIRCALMSRKSVPG